MVIEKGKQAGREMVIADGGSSAFRIVIAPDASPATRHGAEELQQFLKQMTGVELSIVSDAEPMGEHEIILGESAHLKELGVQVDFKKLGGEGYVIKTLGSHLLIAGGALRGSMYGVYGFLEDHLGCRWFTPEVSRIPVRKRLVVGEINDTQIPVLEYRYPFVTECFDADWSARNRMNGTDRLTERHGGSVRFGAGMFVHTFNRLLPPEEFFDKHPEYFSQVKGRRIKERTQLCCTNEDVVRLVTEAMLREIRKDPGASVYSVSQNDWYNYCECGKCQALAEKEGSQLAPVLHLVNRVAEAVEKEFPDKAIETLAYQWGRKAPKTIRPRRNVIIRLCSIECCFSHPLGTCDGEENRAFAADIREWSGVCKRLWVWDYCTAFRHYLLPFPNQRVRDDNIRFFISNNVRGIFEQDCYDTTGSELAGLGGYMNAKFLWNPDYGEDKAMSEFLDGVYAASAPFIREYINLLHDRVEKENIHVGIWTGPDGGHLTDELLAKAQELFDQAEAAVADRPDVLGRVQVARASVDYAMFERARRGISSPKVDHEKFRVVSNPILARRLDPFFAALKRSKLTRLREGSVTDLKAYRKKLKAIVRERALQPHQPVHIEKPANAVPGLAYDYYEGEWRKLPDFGQLKPVRSGTARRFDSSPGRRKENFALKFTGFVKVLRDGVYTFYTTSDDGSKLYIGEEEIVNNDGLHSERKRAGHVALKAGMHPITVTFFQGPAARALEVSYEGPGIKKQAVAPSVLYRDK